MPLATYEAAILGEASISSCGKSTLQKGAIYFKGMRKIIYKLYAHFSMQPVEK